MESSEITAKFVEEFTLKERERNIGYWYDGKSLRYSNCGFEAIYTIPDWENVAKNTRERFEEDKEDGYSAWGNDEDDLMEIISDELSVYRLTSWG